MDINAKKNEIIQHIMLIQEPEIIEKIDRYIRNLEYDDERYYTRKRFYDDGSYKGKKEKKPGLINEARRKIKAKLNFLK